jgi:hypothetical protein
MPRSGILGKWRNDNPLQHVTSPISAAVLNRSMQHLLEAHALYVNYSMQAKSLMKMELWRNLRLVPIKRASRQCLIS